MSSTHSWTAASTMTISRSVFDGPGVLGFVRWWEHGEAHVEGLLREILRTTLGADVLIAAEDLEPLGATLYGAMTAAALAITRAEIPQQTRDAMRETLFQIINNRATATMTPRSSIGIRFADQPRASSARARRSTNSGTKSRIRLCSNWA